MTSVAVVAARPENLGTTCFLLTTASNPTREAGDSAGSPGTPGSTSTRPPSVVAKIAPRRARLEPAAPSAGNTTTPELLRCKRRIHFGQLGSALPPTPPAAVARRNERERNRVRMVNMGFATLRQHVPNGAKNKKMSKVETLRSAVDYIKQLQRLLAENDATPTSATNALQHGHQSPVVDENCFPGCLTMSGSPASESSEYMSHHTDPFGAFTFNFTSPPCSAASSPTPSLGSDASSPYDSLSPEDEDLFARWLS